MHGRWYFDRGHICVYIFPEALWNFLETPIHWKCIGFPETLGFWRRQFIESVYVSLETLRFWIRKYSKPLRVYTFSWNPLDFENVNSLKALVNKGTLYPFKTLKPLNFGTLEILSPAHLVSLTSARGVLCYGTQRCGGRGGGTPYPLRPWSLWIFGPVDPLRPKLDFRSLWTFRP